MKNVLGVAMSLLGLSVAACGDSSGSGAGGAGTGGSGSTTGAGGGTTGTGGAGTGGAGTGGESCEALHPAGYIMAYGLLIEGCGCFDGAGGGGGGSPAPCYTDCQADPACDTSPPGDPAGVCGMCIQGEFDSNGACAVAVSTGAECSGNTDCAAFFMCKENE